MLRCCCTRASQPGLLLHTTKNISNIKMLPDPTVSNPQSRVVVSSPNSHTLATTSLHSQSATRSHLAHFLALCGISYAIRRTPLGFATATSGCPKFKFVRVTFKISHCRFKKNARPQGNIGWRVWARPGFSRTKPTTTAIPPEDVEANHSRCNRGDACSFDDVQRVQQ